MSRQKPPAVPSTVTLEYESLDSPPRYVEGVQGLVTNKGAVQMYFFSDLFTPPPEIHSNVSTIPRIDGAVTINASIDDPYGLKSKNVLIKRRIEANLILSLSTLKEIRDWSTRLIQEEEAKERR